ncbi:MAG: alpha/beta hydrolase [Clostridia bacterium]|nr:alpha/beta hydrolase [Clostridia bacterium]
MLNIPDRAIPFLRARLKKMTERSEQGLFEKERASQELLGRFMQKLVRSPIAEDAIIFDCFSAAMLLPEKTEEKGAVLYLHGGGFCAGDLEYAKWYGKALCSEINVPVLCPAYRLAPEHRFPAALLDALEAYRWLAERYDAGRIVVIGESAGGGLAFSLVLKLKELKQPMPAGIVGISPWVDLTQSGASYETNRDRDPSMTRMKLCRFAQAYCDDPSDPLASPLFAEMGAMPDTLLFAGGDEIMMDDAVRMHEKLTAAGTRCDLVIAPEMWHAYLFYGLQRHGPDRKKIISFMKEHL